MTYICDMKKYKIGQQFDGRCFEKVITKREYLLIMERQDLYEYIHKSLVRYFYNEDNKEFGLDGRNIGAFIIEASSYTYRELIKMGWNKFDFEANWKLIEIIE